VKKLTTVLPMNEESEKERAIAADARDKAIEQY
jgi:hypothetical protein